MSRVRIGVVGVGALGRHHARILGELDSVELVGVADSDAEQARAIAEQCHTQCMHDYRELIGHVDAVSIAVPTSVHLPVGSEFLKREIPVLIEKPLAGCVSEARQLVDLAEKSGALLQVGHIERFNPAMQVAQRAIGTAKYIRCERVSPYAFRSTDIGVVHDLMIHDIDLVLSLVDSPVKSVEALGLCVMGGHEDSVQARVCFESGCIADLTASRVNRSAHRTMQVWSTTGCVNVDFTSRDVVSIVPTETLLYGTSPLEKARQPGTDIEALKAKIFETYLRVVEPPVSSADALTAELSSFVDCVSTGTAPLVSGREALAALEVAEQVIECVATHQWDGHAEGAIGPHARFTVEQRKAG